MRYLAPLTLVVLIAVSAGCASTQRSQNPSSGLHDEIQQREREWAEAMRQRDMEALDKILAAEYRLTFADIDDLDFIPDGFPPYTPRHIWLENTSQMEFGEVTIGDLRVNRLTDRFATAAFRMRLEEWRRGDEALTPEYEVVDLWVLREGRWQVVNRSSLPLD